MIPEKEYLVLLNEHFYLNEHANDIEKVLMIDKLPLYLSAESSGTRTRPLGETLLRLKSISAVLTSDQICYYVNWAIYYSQKATVNATLTESERKTLNNWLAYFNKLRDKAQVE